MINDLVIIGPQSANKIWKLFKYIKYVNWIYFIQSIKPPITSLLREFDSAGPQIKSDFRLVGVEFFLLFFEWEWDILKVSIQFNIQSKYNVKPSRLTSVLKIYQNETSKELQVPLILLQHLQQFKTTTPTTV